MMKSSDILKIRDSVMYNSNVKNDIKIAGLGDIHLSNLVGQKDVDFISQTLYEENPDYICMLGDLIDTPRILENDKKVNELMTLIKNSASIAPTLIVLGSHDFVFKVDDGYEDFFDLLGIWNDVDEVPNAHVLNDKIYQDDKVFIAGYRQKDEVYHSPLAKKHEDYLAYYNDLVVRENLYDNLPCGVPKIFLTHSPEPIHDNPNAWLLNEYDLILTGHYHNGCVPEILDDIWISKNGGIINPKKRLLPKYARGIVKLETGTYLIYNGGWVKIQECAPRVLQPLDSLCNRQMDMVTLTSNEKIEEPVVKSRKKVLKLY